MKRLMNGLLYQYAFQHDIGQCCLTGPQFGNHHSCTNVAVSYYATKLLLDLLLNRGDKL
jgi:hypothetical protein